MKYFSRAKIYKNYNGANKFNPETFEAYSYDWWKFVMKVENTIVFNDYSYSPTTCKHQSQMKTLLRQEFGVDFDSVLFIECPEGLQDLDSGVEYYKRKIEALESLIQKPRTHKSKNQERQELINEYKSKIEAINDLKAKN